MRPVTADAAATPGPDRYTSLPGWPILPTKFRLVVATATSPSASIPMCPPRHGPHVGVETTVEALKQVVGLAEKKKVNICLEYLNSKVNHKGYMFDKMAWGVEVCKRVGSERLKILYDIYHAQIMEGDIISTIQNYHQYIGHYHTGGNPGRNEIDETQELYYPAIMRAIVKTGYTGYVAHEFIPKNDPIESLAYAVRICDV